MFSKKQNDIPPSEEFGVLTATWILACNDKNPIMTYRSIQQRLELENYPLEAIRTVIQSRGELFRKRVPSSYLRRWKQQMLSGKHLPTWMLDVDKSERPKLINDLGPDGVFISQFRADDKQPSWEGGSTREIIDWGLQHIERLRKASMEVRDEIIRKRQLTVLIVVSILNFLFAIANIVISIYLKK